MFGMLVVVELCTKFGFSEKVETISETFIIYLYLSRSALLIFFPLSKSILKKPNKQIKKFLDIIHLP